jgi:hypothetical protein
LLAHHFSPPWALVIEMAPRDPLALTLVQFVPPNCVKENRFKHSFLLAEQIRRPLTCVTKICCTFLGI